MPELPIQEEQAAPSEQIESRPSERLEPPGLTISNAPVELQAKLDSLRASTGKSAEQILDESLTGQIERMEQQIEYAERMRVSHAVMVCNSTKFLQVAAIIDA